MGTAESWNTWITWIIQGVIGIAIGVIGYLWKRDRASLELRMGGQEERIKELEGKYEALPFIYTTREDFIRATASIDNKLDKIYDQLVKQTSAKE